MSRTLFPKTPLSIACGFIIFFCFIPPKLSIVSEQAETFIYKPAFFWMGVSRKTNILHKSEGQRHSMRPDVLRFSICADAIYMSIVKISAIAPYRASSTCISARTARAPATVRPRVTAS